MSSTAAIGSQAEPVQPLAQPALLDCLRLRCGSAETKRMGNAASS
jgi:hypothetical protein